MRRNWTQHWWDFKRESYEVFTSSAVIDELSDGEYPTKQSLCRCWQEFPFPIDDQYGENVETYIRRSLMPADPSGDALHLALASYHECDFLLTWNCQHLPTPTSFSTSVSSMECWGFTCRAWSLRLNSLPGAMK